MINQHKGYMQRYPIEYSENVKYRAELLNLCTQEREAQRQVKEICKRDILYWINCFCWTKDPRRKPSDIPFVSYASYQDKFIKDLEYAIDNQEDALLEKSRDMGASWLVLLVYQHKWLFEDGSDFRLGSRKEDFVDKLGDIDTLFEKLRYNLSRQPDFLLPAGFDWRTHSSYMRMINPENGNSIVGESANENFGTGGRRKSTLLDEFAKWDDNPARKAWTSLADVTPSRIVISTPVGVGNKYQELASGDDIKKITLHWTLHPVKSEGAYYYNGDGKKVSIGSPQEAFALWQKYRGLKPPAILDLRGGIVRSEWYDRECERRNDSEIAQELDIDYLQSGVPFFDSKGMRKQKDLEQEPLKVGELIKDGLEIKFVEKSNGNIIIYEEPGRIENYLVTADASEAIGQDEASAFVGNVRSNSTAAIVAGQHPSHILAEYCVMLSKYYNDCLIIPETKGYGTALCKYIDDLKGNIYRDGKGNMGFITSSVSRPEMLAYTDSAIRQVSCFLYASQIISQFITFVKNPKKGMKAEAASGKQDGLVICFAIFQKMRRVFPYVYRADLDDKRAEARERAINRKSRFMRR